VGSLQLAPKQSAARQRAAHAEARARRLFVPAPGSDARIPGSAGPR
jgi:hypothetical protein